MCQISERRRQFCIADDCIHCWILRPLQNFDALCLFFFLYACMCIKQQSVCLSLWFTDLPFSFSFLCLCMHSFVPNYTCFHALLYIIVWFLEYGLISHVNSNILKVQPNLLYTNTYSKLEKNHQLYHSPQHELHVNAKGG